jgi:hypothetical protein
MPINIQNSESLGYNSANESVRIAGMAQRFDRAAAAAGWSNLACSDQCMPLLFRHGMSDSQFAVNVTPAATTNAPMRISPFR